MNTRLQELRMIPVDTNVDKEAFWGTYINAGARMHEYHGTTESALSILHQILTKGPADPVFIQLQEEIQISGKPVTETYAAKAIMSPLELRAIQAEAELARVQVGLADAMQQTSVLAQQKQELEE